MDTKSKKNDFTSLFCMRINSISILYLQYKYFLLLNSGAFWFKQIEISAKVTGTTHNIVLLKGMQKKSCFVFCLFCVTNKAY